MLPYFLLALTTRMTVPTFRYDQAAPNYCCFGRLVVPQVATLAALTLR